MKKLDPAVVVGSLMALVGWLLLAVTLIVAGFRLHYLVGMACIGATLIAAGHKAMETPWNT